MGLFCCVSVTNKDCTCLVTTYNQLRKLWENKDKQNEMSHNPSHHNGAGPCALHSGEGALHASMFGSNSSLGWLLPLFVSNRFLASVLIFAHSVKLPPMLGVLLSVLSCIPSFSAFFFFFSWWVCVCVCVYTSVYFFSVFDL